MAVTFHAIVKAPDVSAGAKEAQKRCRDFSVEKRVMISVLEVGYQILGPNSCTSSLHHTCSCFSLSSVTP